jgi:pimeloyl-ACP methyl ester carboxylesterase
MVEDLQHVIASLGGKRPALVGASMGGGVSTVAVGEDRIDATALVLVDTAPGIEAAGAAKIQAFMGQHPEGFASLEEVADSISTYQPHRPRPKDLSGLAKNVRLGSNAKYYWHWDPAYRAGRRDLDERRIRLEACARNIRLPTLLVRGEFSDVLTEEGARHFLRLCPHSEYVNVSGAAHMVVGDRNDTFSSAVIDFLQRNVPVDGRLAQPPHELHPHHESPVVDINDVP